MKEESILKSVKLMLGLPPEYDAYDPQIIIDINSTFDILHQLGVGDGDFYVTGDEETWDEIVPDTRYNFIKTYVYMKVRLMFDPPQSSYHLQALKDQIAELEWRINSEVEVGDLTDK